MIYKHDRTSPAQVQTAETTLLPETTLLVQRSGFLSRFHSMGVCKTRPSISTAWPWKARTNPSSGDTSSSCTQFVWRLNASLMMTQGWRCTHAHMHTLWHLCAFNVSTKQHFPAWTLTQTDTGSSPEVNVPIATAQLLQVFFFTEWGELDFRMHKAPLAHFLNKLLPGAAMLGDGWKEFSCSAWSCKVLKVLLRKAQSHTFPRSEIC